MNITKALPIRFVNLDPTGMIETPKKATPGSAGFDLQAHLETSIKIFPGQNLLIGTGLKIEIPDPDVCAIVIPRSGLGSRGLVLGNLTGLIDSDYRGEIKVSLWNRNLEAPIEIEPGMRIAQLVFVPLPIVYFVPVERLEESERGTGGFGSTGLGG